MELSGEREGTIVTLSEAQDILVNEGTIHVVPSWQWLLE